MGKDAEGVPRSAFQRCCQGGFRGDAAGSQKQYGFLIPAEIETCDTVEIYEAPIDAMSGATLRQYKHDAPWRSVHYLALGGLNHQPIDSIPKLSAWHFALTVMNPAGTLQKLWQKG